MYKSKSMILILLGVARGQTALLSIIFVLVGMVVLVPAITETALGFIHATADGTCGPEGQTHPCEFTFVSKQLDTTYAARPQGNPLGKWISEPTQSGTRVTWSTAGAGGNNLIPLPGDEKGSVTYKVGDETAVLYFDNPVFGTNTCSVSGMTYTCTAGKGQIAEFTYHLRGK